MIQKYLGFRNMQEKLESGYAKKSMLSMSNQARNANLTLQIKGRSDFFF